MRQPACDVAGQATRAPWESAPRRGPCSHSSWPYRFVRSRETGLATSPVAIDDEFMAANLDIQASIALYQTRLAPNARYASFDYCYNYFQSFRERGDPEALADYPQLQTSCLQLGFYLASWGMLRGSSVLLQRSVRNFVPVVKAISRMPPDVWAIDTHNYSLVQREALLDAIRRIRNAFPEPASDILVTKTMLGVFGCVPAFDQYFKKGFGVHTVSLRSLDKIGAFYEEHAQAIESHRVPTLSFESGNPTARIYPRAKVIDMIFFVTGGGSAITR